ncbi:MAG: DUF1730 domain-containing protein [Bacteroidales bacterium]|jgi:epoxyqueuosine reductase|nr:DUF1730 domain-containing protein [Bacteroidales bacterium]
MEEYIPFSYVQHLAFLEGFQDSGAAKAEKLPSDFFSSYLNHNYYASMSFLQRNIDIRLNPSLLLPSAKSVFVFLLSYNTDLKPDFPLKIASYALLNDYHKLIKSKLYTIASRICEKYPDFKFKICVDSVPIFEKIWANKALSGSIGKNSLFISKDFGSKVLLGEIICNFSTDYTQQDDINLCNDCTLCIDSCPNNAILPDKTIDSSKCIAYHTKINKDSIPDNIDLWNYIFGCDICLDVCPHNYKTFVNTNADIQPQKAVLDLLNKVSENSMTDSDLRKAKKCSGLENIKFEKLLSNIQKAKNH